MPTHTGSELDAELDEEDEESDEFEGAPELGTFEIDMDEEMDGAELSSLADDAE